MADSRQRRRRSLGRLIYGVLGRTRHVNQTPGTQPDRTQQVYARTSFGLVLTRRRRRTKLEGREPGSETRRRNGKRFLTPTTELVKLGRRGGRFAWRRSTQSSTPSIESSDHVGYEYPLLVRIGTIGLMRVVNANDRIGRYLGIEWLSLTLYVMAGFRRGSAYSTEAGLKYYVVGSFGSAWILLGMSRVYGWTGSVNRTELERRRVRGTESGSDTRFLTLGWELIVVAVLLKLAGVPRHRWLADVYEGSPLASVLYFTVVPKRGLFYLRARRVGIWGVQSTETRVGIPGVNGVSLRRTVISLRSMRVGAIGALRQRRRKRFRAYSAIGHTGYILLGIVTGTVQGVQGTRTYTRIYMVMSRVVWQRRRSLRLIRSASASDRNEVLVVREVKYRTDRAYLGKENPARSARIVRTMMSMAGVPPMAGFVAKLSVFLPRVDSGASFLARAGVRASVIGGFNYLRVSKRRFFEPSLEESRTLTVHSSLSKPRSRRRAREGRRRVLVGRNPSGLLLLTHRIAESRFL